MGLKRCLASRGLFESWDNIDDYIRKGSRYSRGYLRTGYNVNGEPVCPLLRYTDEALGWTNLPDLRRYLVGPTPKETIRLIIRPYTCSVPETEP